MSNVSLTKAERLRFIKQIESKAAENGLNLTQHLAATGGAEMSAILRRMIKAELRAASPTSTHLAQTIRDDHDANMNSSPKKS